MAPKRSRTKRLASKTKQAAGKPADRSVWWGLVAALLTVALGVVVFDTRASPDAARLDALSEQPTGPVMVINRVAPRIVDPAPGDLVMFRKRTRAGPSEELARVVAADGSDLTWRDHGLLVDGNPVKDLPWDRSKWRPARRSGEDLGGFLARFTHAPAGEARVPPRSTGLDRDHTRVPRDRLYVVSASPEGAVSASMVPIGDITGTVFFPTGLAAR